MSAPIEKAGFYEVELSSPRNSTLHSLKNEDSPFPIVILRITKHYPLTDGIPSIIIKINSYSLPAENF